MTFDPEPDLDNANVGIPEQKRKNGKLPNRWLSVLFYCEKLWDRRRKHGKSKRNRA